MNPFDLPGPEFLVFYIVLAVAIHLLWRPLARLATEPADAAIAHPPSVKLDNLDPYLVAYLRGQETETARVAILSMLDRGMLKADGEELSAVPGNEGRVTRPLEREILRAFASEAKAATIFRHAGFRSACIGLREEAIRLGLLAPIGGRALMFFLRVCMLALLAGVAINKISVAIERGRSNVGFLIMLGLAACIAMIMRKSPKHTRRGEAYIEELKERFEDLKDRAESIKPGGASRELVILAAVFGMTALPTFAMARAQALFPKAALASGGSCGSSCGSSSCGSSSCGGGGGCGGCGGCGG